MQNFPQCQKIGNISKRGEIPQNEILYVKPFNCCGIDFMVPLPSSHYFQYILVCVDYVIKWGEASACVANVSTRLIIY